MNQKQMEPALLQTELASNESKLAQLQHQKQRLENRIHYYEQGDRKKRTHRLCTIAGTMESIDPRIRELTTAEVLELLEHIFSIAEVKCLVYNWVQLHRQKYGEDVPSGPISSECHAD